MDDIRNRFLRDRVLTASPAQRVVMLYDRLALDITRAGAAEAATDARPYLGHATQIVAELLGSLDPSAGGPVANLTSLYQYLMRELMSAQLSGDRAGLAAIAPIVDTLGQAWAVVASSAVEPEPLTPVAACSWIA